MNNHRNGEEANKKEIVVSDTVSGQGGVENEINGLTRRHQVLKNTFYVVTYYTWKLFATVSSDSMMPNESFRSRVVKLFCKGPDNKYIVLVGHESSVPTPHLYFVLICKWMGMLCSSKNYLLKEGSELDLGL